jgi:hypothetical protein
MLGCHSYIIYMLVVLLLDLVVEVSVSDLDVSVEVSVKYPEFESEQGDIAAPAPAPGGLLLATFAPGIVATGFQSGLVIELIAGVGFGVAIEEKGKEKLR